MTLIFLLFSNVLAIWVANFFVSGFDVGGGIKELVVAGILLGLFNLTLKPIAKFFTAPLILLTLGLFIIVINAGILLIVDYLLDFVTIKSLSSLLWSTLIIGVINMVASSVAKTRSREHRFHNLHW